MIAITGASSYVGKYLINFFLKKRYKVIGISTNDPEIKHMNFRYLYLNLEKELLDIECDFLIHSAGESSLNLDFEVYYKKNILISYNIKRFLKNKNIGAVLLSSHKVYGSNRSLFVDENSDIVNPCNYGLSKLCAEKVLSDYIILRLPALIANGTKGWLHRIITNLKSNKDIEVYNCLYNNLLHLDDLSNFIEILYQKNMRKDLFTLSANEPIYSKDVVIYLKNFFNSKSKIVIKNGYSYHFLNKKMNLIYQPMSVTETIKHYLKEFQ